MDLFLYLWAWGGFNNHSASIFLLNHPQTNINPHDCNIWMLSDMDCLVKIQSMICFHFLGGPGTVC